jgi:hypothetical protein
MKDLTLFLKSLTPLAVACLLMAAANVIVTIYAWLPLRSHSEAILFAMGLASMGLFFTVFVAVAKHHSVAWKKRGQLKISVSFPSAYWVATLASLIYFLAVFLGGALYYPHGVDLGPSINLRMFSACWLFFSLVGLGFAQWAGLRLRAYAAEA